MVRYWICFKVKPTVFADGFDWGMREREIKDYTTCVGLSNSKDGEIGKTVGGMGSGKNSSVFVGVPIKHLSERLSRQVDI